MNSRLRSILGTVLLFGCILAVPGFTAPLSAQTGEESFESGSLSSIWGVNKGAQIKSTGGANATRSFATLTPVGGQLGGKLFTANTPANGLSDFYLEFYFRVRNTNYNLFNLQIADISTKSALSSSNGLNIRYDAKKHWGFTLGSQKDTSWISLPGMDEVTPEAWHLFRLTARDWGKTNARCELQISGPGENNFPTKATRQLIKQGAKAPFTIQIANSFSFLNNSGTGPGFDVDEISFGEIHPYSGPSVSNIDSKTLLNKVMCGYQGWFGVPGDGGSRSWKHWTKRPGLFEDGNAKIDLWPDVSELLPEDRFPTGFKMTNGNPAEVFSSYKKTTVLKHFEWMQDYGLDGVFVQRFINEVRHPRGAEHFNTVLANCREGANRYGRTYAVMYDLSGLPGGHIEDVMKDWRALRRQMIITEDPAYLHHRGKPVVAVWGVGFQDRQYTLEECRRLVDFLKNDPEAGGCVVMLGVPTHWRELKNDAVSDPALLQVVGMADIISPWTVGRYTSPAEAVRYATSTLKIDQAWCQHRGIDYLPVVFPGFSWHNMYGTNFDQIPRLRGKFLWSQFCEIKRAKASMAYVAMFDEVDEGTAIFKCLTDVPVGSKTKFLTYEGLQSDHYLKLVGAGTKILRGELPLKDECPF